MNREMLDRAIQSISIHAVFLRNSRVRCKEDFLPPFIETDVHLTPQHRFGPIGQMNVIKTTESTYGIAGRFVLLYFEAGVRLVGDVALKTAVDDNSLPDDAVYVEIEAEFCAHYRLSPSADPEELIPALEEFGRYNLGYHVWPYWREYVQSVCTRIGIPTIPIHMYRIPQTSTHTVPQPGCPTLDEHRMSVNPTQ